MTVDYKVPDGAEEVFQREDFDRIAKGVADLYFHPELGVYNTYIAKMTTSVMAVGKNVTNSKGCIVFHAIHNLFQEQVDVHMECTFTFDVESGFMSDGYLPLNLSFPALTADSDRWFVLDNVVVSASSSNLGTPVIAGTAYKGNNTSKGLQLVLQASQASSSTKTTVSLRFTANANNENFGFGQLFPVRPT